MTCLAVTSNLYAFCGFDCSGTSTRNPVPIGFSESTSPDSFAAYRKTTAFFTASVLMLMPARAGTNKTKRSHATIAVRFILHPPGRSVPGYCCFANYLSPNAKEITASDYIRS